MLAKIIGTFITSTPLALEQLQNALGKRDFAAARDLAHGLKSSSASLGALDMSQRCAELEVLADEEALDAAQAKFVDVRDCFPAVRFRLERYVEHRSIVSAREL